MLKCKSSLCGHRPDCSKNHLAVGDGLGHKPDIVFLMPITLADISNQAWTAIIGTSGEDGADLHENRYTDRYLV